MSKATQSKPSAAQDEAEIRRLIANWSRAMESRDVDGLTADYSSKAVLYDAIPAYKVVGVENIRRVWEQCLPCFPDEFRSEHRDLEVHVAGDVAFVFGLHHIATSQKDHPCSNSWMRVTVCYRRVEGAWKVVHEHVSIPFNPLNDKVWHITDPDVLDMPDYGAA